VLNSLIKQKSISIDVTAKSEVNAYEIALHRQVLDIFKKKKHQRMGKDSKEQTTVSRAKRTRIK